MSETFKTQGEPVDKAASTDVDPGDYGKNIDMSNPAKPAEGTPELNAAIEGVFGRVPTYFGRVDLLVAAIGYLGDQGLADYLNKIVDSVDQVASDSSVQGRRDMQQAALDAEYVAARNEANSFEMPDDPRDAQISPIEAPVSTTVGDAPGGLDELASAQGLDKGKPGPSQAAEKQPAKAGK